MAQPTGNRESVLYPGRKGQNTDRMPIDFPRIHRELAKKGVTLSLLLDILSDLDMPHYDNLAYQEYMRIYYDGGDPMAFKDYMDSMVKLAKGQDDGRY